MIKKLGRCMKRLNKIQSLAALVLLISSSAFSNPIPVESRLESKPQSILLIPRNTFIPSGFDDNDNVELIVSGYLPNTCYRAGSATVQVDQKRKKIFLQNTAFFYSDCWCAQVTVPYMHTVNLGILNAGQYQVYAQDGMNQPQVQGQLNVVESKTASPDEFLYAPVQEIFMQTSIDHGQPGKLESTLVVRGQFSSDCMHLQDDVKVLYRSQNIVEVFLTSTLDTHRDCQTVSVPFETQVKIHSPWKGSTLIYVRSLNGQAVSKVIDF
jgi:hypothetical protein